MHKFAPHCERFKIFQKTGEIQSPFCLNDLSNPVVMSLNWNLDSWTHRGKHGQKADASIERFISLKGVPKLHEYHLCSSLLDGIITI